MNTSQQTLYTYHLYFCWVKSAMEPTGISFYFYILHDCCKSKVIRVKRCCRPQDSNPVVSIRNLISYTLDHGGTCTDLDTTINNWYIYVLYVKIPFFWTNGHLLENILCVVLNNAKLLMYCRSQFYVLR